MVTTQPPGSVYVAVGFGLVVAAEDRFGNVDTNFTDSVSVATDQAPLGGKLTVTAQKGVATFSGLTLNVVGVGYRLQVSGFGLPGATTDPFNVYLQTIYTVDLTSASGAGSGDRGDLVYVIGLANANPDPYGSLIQFDPTVFASPQTITLNGTLVLSETAGPEVINGPGASIATVSGGGSVEVFSGGTGVTASLSGLTVSDGSATNGGGIVNAGMLTITDCAIDNNSALTLNSNGAGAIDNVGSMTITDSSIDNNQGDGSGGIRNDGSMTITNCTIAGNSADYGDGGGVNNAGSMTITGSTIAYNYAEFGVGGLANFGSMTIIGSTIRNNSAVVNYGVIDNFGIMTVTNSTIADNDSGGVGIVSGELTIINSVIAFNDPFGLGVNGGAATLYNTIIAQNFEGEYSGAPPNDIAGTVSSISAYNLIGTGGSGGLTNGTNHNEVGVVDPGLVACR